MTMPAPGEQLPEPPSGDVGEAIEAVSLLDRSRQNYFDACADFAQKPHPKTFSRVTEALECYAEAFDLTVNVLPQDGSIAEYGRSLGHLHIHQDNNRVDFLNALLGKDLLEAASLDLEDEEEETEDTTFAPEKLIVLKAKVSSQIKDLFRAGLIEDTNDFAEEVSESAPARKMDRREAIIHHALDVGKVTLGTALGIWATRFLREK